ncbi:MAG: restriction endonuclease subunit S, partial [Alteromonadaceae bacterium]|nr:restriction endonuclease subunit S [Alteromonadaceae bacterium]
PIGHVAINTIPMATNQGFKNLVPKEDIGSSYIYYWLKANKDLLESHGNGATFKEISKSSVSRIPIPLPPLSEQRRISGILDKALRVENLWYQRNAAMEDLGISTFRETVKNNKSSIRYTKLGDLGKWRSGGTPPRHREEYFQGEIPWISSGELGNLYIDSARSRISEKAIRETSAKNVPPGSLMIGMYDTAALKSSIASIHCSCNQAVAFSSLDTKIVDTLFVYYAILDQKKSLLENRRGIRQKNINLSIEKHIEVQLPNLSVQQEFSSLIRRIKNLYCTTEKTSSELFSSLQHHAFQGKL